jgi:hypothetical protein
MVVEGEGQAGEVKVRSTPQRRKDTDRRADADRTRESLIGSKSEFFPLT